MSVQPSEPQAGGLLVSLLMKQEDYKGAVAAAEAANVGLPEEKREDPGLQYLLATAELKAGMKEKGCARFAGLLKKTEDPWMLNSASYALADAGEELALADASTRAALEKLDAETSTWTLDENQATLKAKSSLLMATWDTMGWILHKEKKEGEAASYLRAAWRNRQDTTTGEHLGDVLASLGERADAERTYELTLATAVNFDEYGVRFTKESPEEVRLGEKIRANGGKAEVRPKGTPPAFKSANALQVMRTIPLGASAGRNGTAEYKLLIGSKGVERVVAAGDKELAGGADLVKKAQLGGFSPEGSQARLVRTGILNCHSGVCELVLEP